MPNDDPLPNMTAQQRKEWAQAKVTNRGAAERAPMNTGRGSILDLIETQQRTAPRDRTNEGGRER